MSDVEPNPFADIPVDDQGFSTFLGDLDMSGFDVTFEDQPEVEPILESEPLPFDDEPIKLGDGTCVVCGSPTFRPPGLTKTGRRKRAPKYCDLHSPNVRVQGERPEFIGVESQLRRMQEELADDLRLLGTLAGPLLPVTGYYVIDNADAFTTALLKLAKNNTRVLRVLHRAASVAPVYTVAQTVAGTAYAIQVDTKGADAHTTVGRRLGVGRAYDAVYPNEGNNNTNNSSNNGFQGPPVYATVQ